ncbi:MAG: hypothetical protein NC432_14950 [Roseburia sp.]|nr:hypothetical protein [Roseburia sp.]
MKKGGADELCGGRKRGRAEPMTFAAAGSEKCVGPMIRRAAGSDGERSRFARPERKKDA